jgi:hypothetical protein
MRSEGQPAIPDRAGIVHWMSALQNEDQQKSRFDSLTPRLRLIGFPDEQWIGSGFAIRGSPAQWFRLGSPSAKARRDEC